MTCRGPLLELTVLRSCFSFWLLEHCRQAEVFDRSDRSFYCPRPPTERDLSMRSEIQPRWSLALNMPTYSSGETCSPLLVVL